MREEAIKPHYLILLASWQRIPGAATAAMHDEVSLPKQLTEVHLQRIPVRPGERSYVADGDSAMFACMLDDSYGKLRHSGQNDPLPLNFLGQPVHLLLKCTEEEQDPRLPVGRIGSYGSLGLPQG
jgi:hypothetical protein